MRGWRGKEGWPMCVFSGARATGVLGSGLPCSRSALSVRWMVSGVFCPVDVFGIPTRFWLRRGISPADYDWARESRSFIVKDSTGMMD